MQLFGYLGSICMYVLFVTNPAVAVKSINQSINQSISDLYNGAIIRREGGESEAPG